MPSDDAHLDVSGIPRLDGSGVQRSATGVVLCREPCGLTNTCRMGILADRLDDDRSASFEIECPHDHRETPDLAHGAWTAGVMSEMCGHLPVLLGLIAFMGTVTTRFEAPVPLRQRLTGRAVLERREGRKLFVNATLTAPTGLALATTSAIMIAAREADLLRRMTSDAPAPAPDGSG